MTIYKNGENGTADIMKDALNNQKNNQIIPGDFNMIDDFIFIKNQ